MGLISKETLEKMWKCQREIETGKKLLADIKEVIDNNHHDPHAQHLKDAFGSRRDLQLGIPCGESSHRLFNVSFDLAKPVILAHMAKMEAELKEANQQAQIEINTD